MNLRRSLVRPSVLVAGFVLSSAVLADAEPPFFPSPQDAAQALIAAAGGDDPEAAAQVLGPGADDLTSGDPVADASDRRTFAAAAAESTQIEFQGEETAILSVGAEGWPFAIPLVRTDRGWRFDVEKGREELINRRIGRNELHAIAVARAYVEAQYEYASVDRNDDGRREYAQKILSTDGERDGLYWPTEAGETPSPLGRLVAAAVAEGYEPDRDAGSEPYQGYLFRILTARGDNARGDQDPWIVDGRLTRGFGLVAHPAEYGNSGIMTFLVDHSGIVRERDLGDDTERLATEITAFHPGRDWLVVTD